MEILQLNKNTDYSVFQNPQLAKKLYRSYIKRKFFGTSTVVAILLAFVLALIYYFAGGKLLDTVSCVCMVYGICGGLVFLMTNDLDLPNANEAYIFPIEFVQSDEDMITAFYYTEDENGQSVLGSHTISLQCVQFTDKDCKILDMYRSKNNYYCKKILYLPKSMEKDLSIKQVVDARMKKEMNR